jgi:hypothetical protein
VFQHQAEHEAPVALAQHQTQEDAQQVQYQTLHYASQPNNPQFVYQYGNDHSHEVQYVTPVPEQDPRQIHQQYFTMYQQQRQHEPEMLTGEVQEPRISENYPGEKHTRIMYRKNKQPDHASDDHENAHYHYSYPAEHSYAYEERAHIETIPEDDKPVEEAGPLDQPIQVAEEKEDVVVVTQKPVSDLYSYHPHHPTYALRIRATKATKRESPITEEEVKKIVKLVRKLKKKNAKNNLNVENRSREMEEPMTMQQQSHHEE